MRAPTIRWTQSCKRLNVGYWHEADMLNAPHLPVAGDGPDGNALACVARALRDPETLRELRNALRSPETLFRVVAGLKTA